MNKSKSAHKSEPSVVLVYGVASFFGARVAEVLCDLGEHVIGIDFPGNHSPLRREGFEYIEVDLLQEDLPASLDDTSISAIIDVEHSSAHIGHDERSLQKLLMESFALKKLLDLSVKQKARFIYSSSTDIYRGLASHETLEHYFDGPELTAYFSFLEGKRYGEALCREYATKFGLDVRIARLGQVYGVGMDLHTSSVLTRAVRMALEGKDLVFDEEGSREYNLIYVDDAAFGLSKYLYSDDPKVVQGILYFVNPERVSAISIAYVLKQYIKRTAKVEFIPEHKSFSMPESENVDVSRTEKILHWAPKIELTEGLERVMTYYKKGEDGVEKLITQEIQDEKKVEKADMVIEQKVSRPNKEEKTEPVKGWLTNKKEHVQEKQKQFPKVSLPKFANFSFLKNVTILPVRKRYVWLTVTFAMFFLTTPLFLTIGFSARGVQKLVNSDFSGSENLFVQAQTVWRFYEPVFSIFGKSEWFNSSEEVFALGSSASRVGKNASLAFSSLSDITSGALQSLGGNVAVTTHSAESVLGAIKIAGLHINQAALEYSLLEKHAQSVQNISLPMSLSPSIEQTLNALWLTRPLIEGSAQSEELLSYFLGVNTPRRFVVLLQNNNELRPTGGFIGSYVVFSVENGNISEVKVDDIYNPDGLLDQKNTLVAPEDMTTFLGPTVVPLRDSNWWTSFPVSMDAFVPQYEVATGETIDGVFALNVSVIQDLLSYTGGVEIASFNEIITAENLSERAQYHAEVGFEPGDSGKRDFLGALFESMLFSLSQKPESSQQALAVVLGKGVVSRNVMAYAQDPETQKNLTQMGISGELLYSAGDYLKIVDSNVGNNKANYWINRTSDYGVSVDRDGNLSGSLTVTWDHTGENNTWPNGTYKNYVRIYLPLGVSHVSVSPPLSNQTQYEESGRVVVAGLVEIPVNTTQSIKADYALPPTLSFANIDTYELVWENQPGLIHEAYSFKLNLPLFLSTSSDTKRVGQLTMPQHIKMRISGVEVIR